MLPAPLDGSIGLKYVIGYIVKLQLKLLSFHASV